MLLNSNSITDQINEYLITNVAAIILIKKHEFALEQLNATTLNF